MPSTANRTYQRVSVLRFVRANLYDLVRLLHESRVALSGFVLVMLAGTAYIRLAYELSYAESLYESFRLLTLQSGLAFPADPIGQALFFLVPLLGLALILDSVFRFGRLVLDKSSRREDWQIALASTYQRHIIVCGLGRLGVRVVEQLLASGSEVVVIEQSWSSEFVPRTLALNVPVVSGDARSLPILRAAGLQRARAVVICIADDLVTIEVALLARQYRPAVQIIQRVFNVDLDSNLEETFGYNTVFSASALAAPTYAAAAISRDVKYHLPVGQAALGVTEMTIARESLMTGFVRRLEEDHGFRLLIHKNAQGKHLPPLDMRQFDDGDRVVLIGSLAALETLRQNNIPRSKAHAALGMLEQQRPTGEYHRVIVCGLGKVGYRTVRQIHAQPNRPQMTVIYGPNTRSDFIDAVARLPDVRLIEGDARSAIVLEEAGLDEAYSVAVLTSDDLVNMQIGLMARRKRREVHLVIRMFSDVLADQLEDLFAIRTVYSTSALAAPTMASAALLGGINHAFFVNQTLYSTETVRIEAGDPYQGRTVAAIRQTLGALVIAIQREGQETVLPAYDLLLAPGDEIVVLASLQELARQRLHREQALLAAAVCSV